MKNRFGSFQGGWRDKCHLQKEDFSEEKNKVILGEKGSTEINCASIHLGEDVRARVGDPVHAQCRRVYTNKNVITSKLPKMEHVTVVSASKTIVVMWFFGWQLSDMFVLRPAGESEEELHQEE